jgi:hypothetical protein
VVTHLEALDQVVQRRRPEVAAASPGTAAFWGNFPNRPTAALHCDVEGGGMYDLMIAAVG